jgi:hypothetical protein
MTRQVKHQRISKKGKPFYAGKRVEDRYFIGRDLNKTPVAWKAKKPSDKNLTYYQLVELRKYTPSPFGDADKDGVINIFDRAPLNARERHQVPPTVKKGNTKLTDNIGIFSLPRLYTCPGKTELCTKYCYAESPERFRSGVVHSRNKNVAWTRRSDFVKVMSEIITNFRVPWFRIHESGDFYNQEYFDKWVEITKNNPQTMFLAYTKNWLLNFDKAPKNLTIRYSVDLSTKNYRNDLSSCYVGVNRPANFFLCKKKCEPGFCMACWDKDFEVYIPIHSVSKKDVDVMFFKQFNSDLPRQILDKIHRGSRLIGKKPLSTNTALQRIVCVTPGVKK